jgi:hypothetical protein
MWSGVCGQRKGLLCFILFKHEPLSITRKEWQDFPQAGDEFHALLNDSYIDKLSAAGCILEGIVISGLQRTSWP